VAPESIIKYPDTGYNYQDGWEDHGYLIDWKDYDWKQAQDIDMIRFGKTLDCPERGIPLDECFHVLTALKVIQYPIDREMTIVETGMFYGTSTRIFLGWALKNGGKVYTAEVNVRENFKQLMDEAGYWKYVTVIGNSLTCEWNKPIDFLFIDSGHAYNLAWGEYEKFVPYLVPNAIVGWHDTMTNEGGVRPAIEHAKEVDTLELLVSAEVSNGIEFYRFIKRGKE